MNRDLYRRLPLIALGLMAFLALSSSSAFAAGKPIIVTYSLHSYLGGVIVSGTVNPNGAATTYKISYYEEGSSTQSTQEISIGSGTSPVAVSKEINALLPNTFVEAWIVAKNSFGTSTGQSGGNETGVWYMDSKKEVYPAPYASKGTFEITFDDNFKEYGTISCSSTGSGKIIGYSPSEEEYNITLKNCGVYVKGVKKCSAVVTSPIHLNDRLVASSKGLVTISTSFGCYVSEEIEMAIEVFTGKVNSPSGEHSYGVELPIVFSAKGKFGAHEATVTDKSTWSLTGEDSGNGLGLFYW
jgi:hypothetical protein